MSELTSEQEQARESRAAFALAIGIDLAFGTRWFIGKICNVDDVGGVVEVVGVSEADKPHLLEELSKLTVQKPPSDPSKAEEILLLGTVDGSQRRLPFEFDKSLARVNDRGVILGEGREYAQEHKGDFAVGKLVAIRLNINRRISHPTKIEAIQMVSYGDFSKPITTEE